MRVVVVVVFAFKTVPISAQYVLTSVVVELKRTPSKRVHIMKNQKEIKGSRKVHTNARIGKKTEK